MSSRLCCIHFQTLRDLSMKIKEHDDEELAKDLILKTIDSALKRQLRNSNHELVDLPTNPENYISYCDLIEVSTYSSRIKWFTFVLEDKEAALSKLHGENGALPLWKLRKSLKKKLGKELLASVQTEVKFKHGVEMMFIRIASTKILKNAERTKVKLLTAKPTFLVYFPGEPYFYADKASPDESHCTVGIFF